MTARIGLAGIFVMVLQTIGVLAGDPLVHSGDRVVLLGGTLIESLQSRGDEEVMMMLNQPTLRVPLRNMGWSGDDVAGSARRVFGSPQDGYTRLLQDLEKAKPTVAVLGYGYAEASNGLADVARYRMGLQRLTADLQQRSIRVIYLLPIAMPGVKTADYADALTACRTATTELAAEAQLPVIDPAAAIKSLGRAAFDDAGLRLSDSGQQAFGAVLASGLLGRSVAEVQGVSKNPAYGSLSELVAEKNALFFHHYRPMNETYLFLFRKHEQGNNAVEVDQFEPLVQELEAKSWGLAAQSQREG